ncbi:MAG: 23S rRNA (uracil(1939)-C(5))-methyltransferase RlmD, partial [Ruminococcus sp.]|nr:23S rRNA (uracil(1939)-C(5))-methyltransferase RlmD [Ruminococcus sp.]
PPRAGSDKAFISALCKISPKKVVYISCNPETMARDVKLLCQGGYKAEGFYPVDMFPHTQHVECVALLTKKDAHQK